MKSPPALPPEHRLLLICRHAKSSWEGEVCRDIDRPLNKRGQRDAPEMGQRLKRRPLLPDLIITSPAVRALTTAELIAAQLGYPLAGVRINPAQYAATVPSLLAQLRLIEPQYTRVMIVGHNPEFTALANVLGGLAIDNLPTCGMVALALPLASWDHLAPGSGTLVFYDFPKNNG